MTQYVYLLADMEQRRRNTPEDIISKNLIQNGINVIHIEDRGEKNVNEHLGDQRA